MSPDAISYPRDSVPGLLASTCAWWERTPGKTICRGRLLWGFCPVFDLKPLVLQEQGRVTPTGHHKASFKLVALSAIGQTSSAARIPVAALPVIKGEVKAVYRAKRRPMLVIGAGGEELPPEIRKGIGWQKEPFMLAAPYFGGDQGATRGGWPEEFVKRIRRAEYPQYAYDQLPLHGPSFSVLRLDQIQPVHRDPASYELTDYRLSDDAMDIINSWLEWLITGGLEPGSMLEWARKELLKLP
jgi:hypothetical protein